MSGKQSKKVVVIGAGLGGLSAAISLRQRGYEVAVYEKNGQIGGKLNLLRKQGYTFDLGPSILTLPQLFERLFARSGRRMADYIPIRTVRPHWRNFSPGPRPQKPPRPPRQRAARGPPPSCRPRWPPTPSSRRATGRSPGRCRGG